MSKDTFTLNIPISKIDEEQRIVTGIATSEALDSQGDIVDYEASKKAFSDWVGNIREMHGDTAIGKAIDVQFDDDNKQVILSAYISKSPDGENAWTKVKEGILQGFSIGGRVFQVAKDKAVEGANRIVDYALSETSLVDNPACPDAMLLMVKSAKGGLQRVETLNKAGVAVMDSDPRDASGNTVSEVINGTAPKKAGTVVPKKVYGRDGRTTTDKANTAEMKKSVYDALEAAQLATQLSYLIMCEEPDQADDLITAFNALRDFIGKEVAEGDDFILEADSVMELARQAVNLRKDKGMAKEEIEKTNVIGGVERDEEAVVVADERPENVVETETTDEKVEAAEAEAVEAPAEEVKEADVTEEPAEEAAPAEAPVEEPAAEEEKKADEATDLIKSVQSLLTKLNDGHNTDLKKVVDAVSDLGAKVEKNFTSLEERIEALEKQPVATKAKASYVIDKGSEVEATDAVAELQKRQDYLVEHPADAKPGEMYELSLALRKAQLGESISIK